MADLEYNIDKLKEAEDKLQELYDDLNNLSTELDTELVELESQWNTPAGKSFFENHKADWSEDVKKYLKTLRTIKKMLKAARKEYELVDNEALQIKI